MSHRAMNWATSVRGVTSTQKLVLMVLADDYRDDEDRCFPNQNRIAERSCLSKRAVVTALAKLSELGLISIAHRQRENGSRTSNEYHINFDRLEPCAETLSAPDAIHSAPHTIHSAPGSHLEPLLEPLPKPLPLSSKSLKREFEDIFWPPWPHKVDKANAVEVFIRVRKSGVELEAIVGAIQPYKANKPEWQEYMGPAKWLRGRRWEDQHGTTTTSATPKADKAAMLAAHRKRMEELGIYAPETP